MVPESKQCGMYNVITETNDSWGTMIGFLRSNTTERIVSLQRNEIVFPETTHTARGGPLPSAIPFVREGAGEGEGRKANQIEMHLDLCTCLHQTSLVASSRSSLPQMASFAQALEIGFSSLPRSSRIRDSGSLWHSAGVRNRCSNETFYLAE